MKLHSLCAVGAALAATLAASQPAVAATHAFSTSLTGAANGNGSLATGSALVTFDDVLNNVAVHVTFAGLDAPATAAHIHCCVAPPGTIGVALGFSAFPSATSGTYDAVLSTFNGANTFASVLAGTTAGNAYVNIHNTTFPGGEIRGFLAPVPEPETYALMLAGLGLLGWTAQRRQRG